MSKEYCNICCDSYNKSSREKICCGYCDYPSCKTCCETYILSENIPKCMNTTCAKEWSRKFIREKFTNVFINTRFKNHLEELLFDQEKALLPATQPIIEEKIRKDNIKKEMAVLDNLIQDLYVQKRQLERNLYINQIDTSSKKVFNYVRACSSEDCRGFLSSQWKCGICEKWTCPECHELKGFDRDCEHTCNPELVETAKLLAKDTKSCPKCQNLARVNFEFAIRKTPISKRLRQLFLFLSLDSLAQSLSWQQSYLCRIEVARTNHLETQVQMANSQPVMLLCNQIRASTPATHSTQVQ